MKKICVMGLGYIGLPTASILANNDFNVLGVDINHKVIEKLKTGIPHIEEPELKGIFINAISNGKLRVSEAMEESDVFIISVPTPLNKEKKADLSYVISASEAVSKCVKKGDIVILESTSPPGTTRNIVGEIIKDNTNLIAGDDYFLAFCPERVLPGRIIYELVYNDRVIGGIDNKSAIKAKEIYDSFVKGNIFLTDLETAEMVKLVENTFRDINLAFSNELTLICRDYNINIWEVIKFANMHPRVNILKPGPGVGGHCIPIDPWFIIQDLNRKNTLIENARNINDGMPEIITGRILELVKNFNNPKVTLFGISYKENVGDVRESPAIDIYEGLIAKKINVSVYDPLAENSKYKTGTPEESLQGSDLLVLLAGHDAFKELDLKKISGLMNNKIIYDTRNFFDKADLERNGFEYHSI